MNKTLTDSTSSNLAHNNLERSATLNRKYVSRPTISVPVLDAEEKAVAAEIAETSALNASVAPAELTIPVEEPAPVPEVAQSPAINHFTISVEEPTVNAATPTADATAAEPAAQADEPLERPAPNPFAAAFAQPAVEEDVPRPTPRELKDEAIQRAVVNLAAQSEAAQSESQKAAKSEAKKARKSAHPSIISRNSEKVKAHTAKRATKSAKTAQKPAKKALKSPTPTLAKSFKQQKRSSGRKFFLAFATSAACIAVLAYFVNLNLPTISVRVAAMQTGIEASYPTYVPRDFSLAEVSSDKDGVVTMTFNSDDLDFTLTEEKSSWDSNAVLNNYVKPTFGDDYDTLREQGITIYVSNSRAAWVNGGILYKITSDSSATLTKKQIKNIAISL